MPLMGPDAEGREGRGKAWGLCRLSGLRGATGSSCWGPQMLAGPCCGSQAACSGPLGGGTAEGLPCVDRYGGRRTGGPDCGGPARGIQGSVKPSNQGARGKGQGGSWHKKWVLGKLAPAPSRWCGCREGWVLC